MEKKIKIACLLISFGFIFSNFVFAAKGNTNFLNGKPFGYLYSMIQDNQSSIFDLQSTTTELKREMNEVTYDISVLESSVSKNSEAIQNIQTDISSIKSDIMETGDQLGTLYSNLRELSQDVDNNAGDIDFIREQISELERDVESNIANLVANTQAMKSELDEDKAALDILRVRLTNTENSVYTQISELKTEIQTIREDVAINADLTANDLALATYQISTLTADIQDLNTTLSDLQAEYNAHRHSFNDAYNQYITEIQVIIGYTQVWNGEYYLAGSRIDSSCTQVYITHVGYINAYKCKKYVQQPVYGTQEVINYDTTDGETGTPNQ